MKHLFILLSLTNIFLAATGHLHLDWDPKNAAFDPSFYEEFLDPDLCQEHLDYVRSNTALALKFVESGLRVPRGILDGNLIDLGNYFQCLGIKEDLDTSTIEGKYCTINVPLNQEFQILEFNNRLIPDNNIAKWINFDPSKLKVDNETLEKLGSVKDVSAAIAGVNGEVNTRTLEGTAFENLEFLLAVCIPKTCTTQEWMNGLLFNVSAIGFEYTENFCRVNDDKPWVASDYVAIVIFSMIGFITILSTGYDVWHTFIIKSDPKQISPLRRSFSLYTNGRRLTTFNKIPGALECIDGIRAISMAWVILGHTFSTLPNRLNFIESSLWSISIDSTWVTAAPISVDTFFMLSGLLLVYTTAGKFTGIKLLKNIHVFYLNRLLRMFPLLATAVLVQASFLYRLSDGPLYNTAARETDKCRTYWWTTLLYFQNYANTLDMCLGHTWYLAVDMHLHILSPLILFWVLSGKKLTAWLAIAFGLISILISSTVYNFIMEFPGAVIAINRNDEHNDYMVYYYLNTLTRASPFFVGMFFGYLLHLYREKKIYLHKFTVFLLWICGIIMLGLGIFSSHPMKNADWDNQVVDSLINSFSRPIWAAGIGWVIFACVQGYGGPLDWFLSLHIWKLPSRLSYGMYLFHFQIMFVTAGSVIAPIYFTPMRTIYRFICELSIAIMVSFFVTLFIDSPFSTIFKLLLGGGPKKPSEKEAKSNMTNTMSIPRPLPVNGSYNGKYYMNKL